MEKILKVCRVPYNGKQTNGISIKGEYLKKYGFSEGDFVKVTIKKNCISIERTENNELLKSLSFKNPSLNRLIENLDLIPA